MYVLTIYSIYYTIQGTLGAVIVAQLCVQQALSLELFGCLPEDNEFAFSSK